MENINKATMDLELNRAKRRIHELEIQLLDAAYAPGWEIQDAPFIPSDVVKAAVNYKRAKGIYGASAASTPCVPGERLDRLGPVAADRGKRLEKEGAVSTRDIPVSASTERDPEAPYGRKADGTPRAKPGRKAPTK